ncbi:MAG: YybH family protein [Gaiellaceae bacterium]
MPAHKPEECDLLVIKAIEEGDIEAAVALYEPDATFVVSPDNVVTGLDAIREVMQGFIDSDTTFDVEGVTAVPSGDGSIAVLRAKATATGPGPDGKTVTTPVHTIEVVRRQPDGTWRFIIDDPGGEGAV